MDVTLGKGIFLVAAPSLRDPNFRQTVVLLCEHGSQGALGVVVNRPTAIHIAEAAQVGIAFGKGESVLTGHHQLQAFLSHFFHIIRCVQKEVALAALAG